MCLPLFICTRTRQFPRLTAFPLALMAAVTLASISPVHGASRLDWRIAYDDQGRFQTVTDPAGRVTEFDYRSDSRGRLSEMIIHRDRDPAERFRFNEMGQVVESRIGDTRTRLRYDRFARLAALQTDRLPELSFSYDSQNRRRSMQLAGIGRIGYRYDYLNRLEAITTPIGEITYRYDLATGRTIRVLPNGVKTIWALNAINQLQQLTHVDADNRILAQYDYNYGADGRIAAIKEYGPKGERRIRYHYDHVKRLTLIDDSLYGVTRYRYDEVGNRISRTGPAEGVTDQSFDALGRLSGRQNATCGHDRTGNFLGCGGDLQPPRYRYDAADRLRSVRTPTAEVHYRYDAGGRLRARQRADNVIHFITNPSIDAWQPLAIKRTNAPDSLFVWDHGTVLLHLVGQQPEYYLHDHQGTARLLVNDRGKIQSAFDYRPFGAPHANTGPALKGMRPGFAGMFYDAQTGLYMTGVRAYDPELGRFLQTDPQLRLPTTSQNDLSLWTYAANDPVNFTDRSGADRQATHAGIIDWSEQAEQMDQAMRSAQQQHLQQRREILLTNLADAAKKTVDDTIASVFANNDGLRTFVEDFVAFSRRVPAGQPLDVRPFLRDQAEMHLRRYLQQPQLELLNSAAIKRKLTNTVVDAASRIIATHVGQLRTLEALKDPGKRPTLRTTILHDLNRSYTQFTLTSVQRAGYFRRLIDQHYGFAGGALPNSLIKGTPATAGLSAASTVMSSFIGGLDTGIKYIDLTTRALQSAFTPAYIHLRTESGWRGRTSRTTPNGVRFDAARRIDIDSLGRKMGKIYDIQVQSVTTPLGRQQRIVERQTKANWFTRAIMQARPIELKYDQSVTRRTSQMQYRTVTQNGRRQVQALPSGGTTEQAVMIASLRAGQSGLTGPQVPSPVGGVYLGGIGADIDVRGQIAGITRDPESGRLILVNQSGDIESRLSNFRLGDVATIFKCVYGGESPWLSIDPDRDDPNGPTLRVRQSECIKGSLSGWILFESDRALKSYSLSVDSISGQRRCSTVPGYRYLFSQQSAKPQTTDGDQNWERIWIMPAAVRHRALPDSDHAETEVRLHVRAMPTRFVNGRMEDDDSREISDAAQQYKTWFSDNYDAIAAEYRYVPPAESGITRPLHVFAELKRLALLTAIAERLRDRGTPMPDWIRDYPVKALPPIEDTPSITVSDIPPCNDGKTANKPSPWVQSIYGGVGLTPKASDVHVAALARFPAFDVDRQSAADADATGHAEPVTLSIAGRPYAGIALPADRAYGFGANRLTETDLTLQAGDETFALQRRFHSFFLPGAELGRSWSFDWPQLTKVVGRNPDNGDLEIRGFRLTSPLRSWHARFTEQRHVPSLNANAYVSDDPAMLALTGTEDARIGEPTRVILLQDGGRFHFNIDGELVAQQQGHALFVLRRHGDNGAVRQIEAWHQRRLSGSIALRMDHTGTRYLSATHSDGRAVIYRYDEQAHLAHVSGPDGNTRYAYAAHLVHRATGVNGHTQRFDYDRFGRLVAHVASNGEHRRYHYRRTANGYVVRASDAKTGETMSETQYDARHRPHKKISNNGTAVHWHYAANGDTQTDLKKPDGTHILFKRDAAGMVLEAQSHPAGGALTIAYDRGGRITTIAKDSIPAFSQSFHPNGLLGAVETDSQTVLPQYEQNGNLTKLVFTHPNAKADLSRWTAVSVDAQRRPIRIRDHTGTDIAIDRDQNGNPTTLRSNRNQLRIERDSEGRTTAIVMADGPRLTYRYGSSLQNHIAVANKGRQAIISLDNGHVAKIQQFDGAIMRFTTGKDAATNRLHWRRTAANGLTVHGQRRMNDNTIRVEVGKLFAVRVSQDSRGRTTQISYRSIH